MQPSDFTEGKSGRLVNHARGYWAFVPDPLPPRLELTWELAAEISAAERGLSELAGLTRTLPNPHLLIRPFMKREAVLSSRIEGTEASLSDLFQFEASKRRLLVLSDVREVQNYVKALEFGLKRLEELPISKRLLKEMHAELMRSVRGGQQALTPGEFRTSQNWIGAGGCTLSDAKFVPPPPEDMMDALSDLEKFLHAPSKLPLVVRLALVHYQFEAIHPFVDGNGRIGRLLITLLLCAEKALPQPMLYLSAYFERNRTEYYRLLLAVSQTGSWTEWVSYFLRGVTEQANDAIRRAEKLLRLWQGYREVFQSARSSALLPKLVDQLFNQPYLTVTQAADLLKVSYRAADLNVKKLVDAGILKDQGGAYNRVFVASQVMEILDAGEIK